MDGKLRTLFGYELLFVEVSAYDGLFSEEAHGTTGTSLPQGQTLLTQERNDPTRWQRYNIDPESYNGGRMGLLQIGLIYDTRDLETDPTRGILAEYAQEISDDWTGSEFSFSKHLLQLVHYSKIASPQKTRCVFAQRVALGYNRGTRIPWTEVLDQWSANYGGITALGGPMSMRGYRRGRFVAPVTCFINSELRFRFAQRRVWRQQLALSLVPFVDVGNVWDGWDKLDMQMWKWSVGSGLRLVWNQSTVLRADLAFSQEDRQFFFGFNHVF
jgi:outer membrane protein assembly factor BamA